MNKTTYEPSDKGLSLKKGDSEEPKDDNSSWLISFVDLISILLIFSFTLFIAMPKGSTGREDTPAPSAGSPLLFNIAHASTNEDINPVHLKGDVSGSHLADMGERVISRHAVFFSPEETSLRASAVTGLGNLASLSKNNPYSKIIITTNRQDNPDKTLTRANNIIDYFTLICSIERDKIFLQSLSERDARGGGAPEKDAVDVKLIKDFWNF